MAFLVGAFIIMGGFFFWTLYKGLALPTVPTTVPAAPGAPAPPPAPPPPSVTLSIHTAKTGNSFIVQWCDLPENTAALDILRQLKKGVSPWTLWKQIQIAAGDPSCNSASFDIGSATYAEYSFFVETISNLTDAKGNITGQSVTWTSAPSTAEIASTTVGAQPSTAGTNTGNTSPPGTQTQTSASATTATATTSAATTTTAAPAATTSATTTATVTPTGTPYYSPSIQLSGYGTGQTGSFWVQYVDQKIEIGWQGLPTSTNAIVILRAAASDGPWTTILTRSGIDPTGPSTIQIVDDTLGQTSYYELQADAGTEVIAVYGPLSLPPLLQ